MIKRVLITKGAKDWAGRTADVVKQEKMYPDIKGLETKVWYTVLLDGADLLFSDDEIKEIK